MVHQRRFWRHVATVGLFVLSSALSAVVAGPELSQSAHLENTVVQLSSGTAFVCARTSLGRVQCWGSNSSGQLGRVTATSSTSEVSNVQDLAAPVTDLASGYAHACALESDNRVQCWGDNSFGQLGTRGPTSPLPSFVQGLPSGVRVVSISAAQNASCALLSPRGHPNQVWCWGEMMGATTPHGSENARRARPVANLSNVRSLVGATCAVTTALAVWCWSSAAAGASPMVAPLSSGPAIFQQSVSQLVSVALADCALLTTRKVVCVGENSDHQLGTTATSAAATPVAVEGLTGPTRRIDGGYGVTCAVSFHGALRCWGLNNAGQLGTGTTFAAGVAQPVVGLSSHVRQVVVGAAHVCALVDDGSVWCWGDNSNHQLATASTTSSLVPVALTQFALRGP